MTRKTKTILLLTSIAVFLILSYFLALYASGYKFDFKKLQWLETGSLLTKTNIEGASVYLNSRYLGKTSFLSNTLVNKNLLPGKYSLRIEKLNHYPLVKEFEIKSGLVSQLVHLYLPQKQEIDEFILEQKALGRKEEINDILLSPDKKKLAFVGQNEITVVWQKDDDEPPYFRKDREELVLRIGQKINQAFWFKTSWHLIYLTDSGETRFIDLDPSGGRNDLAI